MSHDANHAKEIAKSELGKVDLTLLAERQQREKDLQERRAQVRPCPSYLTVYKTLLGGSFHFAYSVWVDPLAVYQALG